MPDDLNDELRALLHERADHAPPAPAPTEAYVRRVTRRRTARTGAALTAGALALTGIGVAGAAALQPRERAAAPADAGRDPGCRAEPDWRYAVNVHPTELRFHRDCYVVAQAADVLYFWNPQDVPHALAIRSVSTGKVVHESPQDLPTRGRMDSEDHSMGRLRAGHYELLCRIHPEMRARLVVR